MRRDISQCDVVQAFLTEPLQRGAWIKPGSESNVWTKPVLADSTCSVCAVGAVLRQELVKAQSLMTISTFSYRCDDLAANGYGQHPLLRLMSNKFEPLFFGTEISRRWQMIKWAAENVPTEGFRVDL